MKVLVIGSGNMAAGFVKQLSAAGHQVRVAGRDQAKAQALAKEHGASAVDLAVAAQGMDAVVVATPYEQAVAALHSVGNLSGQVVIDITNPLTAD